jgi:hypothetical protein
MQRNVWSNRATFSLAIKKTFLVLPAGAACACATWDCPRKIGLKINPANNTPATIPSSFDFLQLFCSTILS